jgi:HAD superfamily hydrolase (TIGR01459 family)
MRAAPPRFTEHFSSLAADYDVALCDVWGVVHNSIVAFPDACEALVRFRRQGGCVVLITNAPRPGDVVVQLLDKLKVPRTAYDAIVSSGDVSQSLIAERAGARIFHIGPQRDLPMFEGLHVRTTALEQADYVVCSGLFDDTVETPQDYADLIERLRERRLLMICANPDIVVERGEQLVYCAGAVAELYAAAGGEVLYAGKPYRPIYEQALAAATKALGRAADKRRVLAIGDSIRTDVRGAAAFGIDGLFISGGIHAEELGGREDPDPAALAEVFAAAGLYPKWVMRRLIW